MPMYTAEQAEKLLMKTEDLELGARASRSMKVRNISHVAVLLTYGASELSLSGVAGRRTNYEIQEVITRLGFEVGELHKYADDFRRYAPYTEADLRSALQAGGLIPRPTPPVRFDDFENWVMAKLPENLQGGLKPEWLRSVLADKSLQERVRDVVVGAITAKLGLTKE